MDGITQGAVLMVGLILVGSFLAAFCGFWGWVTAGAMYDAIYNRGEK